MAFTCEQIFGKNVVLLILIPEVCFIGPKREIVSIYNEKFTTPENRHPYFIEVYRCVAIDNDDDLEKCRGDYYPVEDTWKNITIVVPDRSEKEFYKYVVYIHTSCKCEGPKSVRKLRWSEKGILGESIRKYRII